MRTLELGALLALFYGPGFITAAVLTRRGHDGLAWTYAAWMAGVLIVPVAVAWVVYLRRSVVAEADRARDLPPRTKGVPS